MSIAKVDIYARTNADWAVAFIYQVQAPDGTLSRRSLVGATLKLNVRAKPQAAEALALSSLSGGGITITDALQGEFTVVLTRDQLNRILGPGEYVHDLIVEYASGRIDPIWAGTLENELGVTRT